MFLTLLSRILFYFQLFLFVRNELIEGEGDDDFVNDVVLEIVDAACNTIFENVIQSRLKPYAVFSAKNLLLDLIKVCLCSWNKYCSNEESHWRKVYLKAISGAPDRHFSAFKSSIWHAVDEGKFCRRVKWLKYNSIGSHIFRISSHRNTDVKWRFWFENPFTGNLALKSLCYHSYYLFI